VDECKHYYSGFKLLFLDVRVSSGIVWKVLNGYTLSRRESRYGFLPQSTYINRDETGQVYLPTQLERTLQLCT
jgi:hypothetical protein